MVLKEKDFRGQRNFQGKVVELTHEKVELENGQQAMRELIHHNGGVCVVPIDDEGQCLYGQAIQVSI